MGARRKPQPTEVELVKALCNNDEITRLNQINLALSYKNTEVIQENLKLQTELTECKKIADSDIKKIIRLQTKLDDVDVELGQCEKKYSILETAYEQRVQELNAITSKWWYKLFV